ncbi:MAG TPA: hypothetical protein VE134_10055, partial [Methanomicrobiales archaeon]|nr:hypothetical protein [Methanomicrobiales archaeon]
MKKKRTPPRKREPWRKGGPRALHILWRSLLLGALILVPGAFGYISGNLWLFPSLGPSFFLQVESPHLVSARAYNTVVGHLIGIATGYLAIFVFGAAVEPSSL